MTTLTLIPKREDGAVVNVIQSAVIGIALTALSYVVALQAGWVKELSWLEVAAVFTSYACTFLCVMERRINYPIGAISTALYCVLFYQYGLYASSAINGFLMVYLLYGWFRWRDDTNTRPVTRANLVSWGISIGVAAAGFAVVYGITRGFGAELVWTDAVVLVGTILAQFMLDNKKLENWFIWAIVNVFAIYTYFTAGLPLAGFQYIFFLLNTGWGYFAWRRNVERT